MTLTPRGRRLAAIAQTACQQAALWLIAAAIVGGLGVVVPTIDRMWS